MNMNLKASNSNNNPGEQRLRRRLSRSRDEVPEPLGRARRIGFVGLSAGAGTTSVTHAAATVLTEMLYSKHGKSKMSSSLATGFATVLELDTRLEHTSGYPFDKIGIDRHFAGRNYHSYYRLAADGKPLSGAHNLSGGINWALRLPGERDIRPETAGLIRLVNGAPGDIVLCDIGIRPTSGSTGFAEAREILTAMDRLVCVIDPLPSRLLAASDTMELIRMAEAGGNPVDYAVNKMNHGVNTKELFRFLPMKEPYMLPAIPLDTVYACEFCCKTLGSVPEFSQAMSPLCKAVVNGFIF